MNITVFGGSQPKPNEQAYQEAYLLGKLIANQKHTVLTGGYIGTMEAVSKGAAEAGGHVIGVTCEDIEAWRSTKPNLWVKEERRFKTLPERLNGLINGCDAALALPGGPGTLTEISLMWNLMIIQALPRKPLILIGAGWKAVIETLYTELNVYTASNQRDLLQFAADYQAAIDLLSQ